MDIETKIEMIKIILANNAYSYSIITDKEVINVAHDLLINNIIPVTTDNREIITYIAVYYEIKKDTENLIKYYLMAIDKKDPDAMHNLGAYYKEHKDYENMKKYYLMAVEQDYEISMNALGFYYYEQKDYENMMKYYLMAIKKGDETSMINLGYYYQDQKDYENMLKYYLMAIKSGHKAALSSLSNYFMVNNKEKGLYVLYDLHKQGVLDADTNLIELLRVADNKSFLNYIQYIKNIDSDLEKRNTEIIELKTYITELELAPEGPKYKEAKEHFELLSTMKMS
jgi:TPR repeat protein